MKLETLHEVKYVGAKTLDKVMSYVDEDSSITDGFIMRIERHYDNTLGNCFAYLTPYSSNSSTSLFRLHKETIWPKT